MNGLMTVALMISHFFTHPSSLSYSIPLPYSVDLITENSKINHVDTEIYLFYKKHHLSALVTTRVLSDFHHIKQTDDNLLVSKPHGNALKDGNKNDLIHEIETLTKECVALTDYPPLYLLMYPYDTQQSDNNSWVGYRNAMIESGYNIPLREIFNHYAEKAHILKNEILLYLKNPNQYFQLRKRIQVYDYYEKCYLYASGYSHKNRTLKGPMEHLLNIEKVKDLARKIFILAYKNNLVSYIMSTDSSYAMVPTFMIKEYLNKYRYDREVIDLDVNTLEDFFEYLNGL